MHRHPAKFSTVNARTPSVMSRSNPWLSMINSCVFLLFSIGLNAIFVGILGEYIGRIYDDVRIRPISVIERSINISDQPENSVEIENRSRT